ncbi:MAG TPA: GAF domain-containing protein, partial [Promineifilum sp.]
EASRAQAESDRERVMLQGKLEEQTEALLAVEEIGRQIAPIQELDRLLSDAVQAIKDHFDLYHVQVYLAGPTQQELILRAATGEAGEALLRLGHRLELGPGSINGTAAASRQAVVVPDVSASPVFLPNPILPETRSEAAVPMIFDDRVMGTLNLQSGRAGDLGPEKLPAFTMLAAQLGAAIENARSFGEATRIREESERQAQLAAGEGWEGFLRDRPMSVELGSGRPVPDSLKQAIAVGDTTIGYISVGNPTGDSGRAQSLTSAVAGQLGAHLENLRLTRQAEAALQEARRRERELALLNRVVTAVSASTDLQTSLQIIVDQLAMATSIQQVGIAILNEQRSGLTVVADRSGQLNTSSAVGFVIPLENNPATQLAISERRAIIVPDATSNPLTASAHEVLRQRGVRTILILPLVVENEVIGTVGLDVVEEGIEVTDDQLRLAETIVYQAASAVRQARLFDQAEEARDDAERLYALSGALNAAGSSDEIVRAIVASGLAEGASSISLSAADYNEEGRLLATPVALWVDPGQEGEGNDGPVPARLHLPDVNFDMDWTIRPNEPVLVENVAEDDRIDERLRALYDSLGVMALVSLPLRVRDVWVGMAVLAWRVPHPFAARERRNFQAMSTQLAVALANQLLFDQVSARSRQLESLSHVEEGLSLAGIEQEILAALLEGPQWVVPPELNLIYLAAGAANSLNAEVISRIRYVDGQKVETVGQGIEPPLLGELWLDKPRELQIIEDIERDPRLDESTRERISEQGWRSLVLIPLRRSGEWQGLIMLGWPAPYELSVDERFVLERLHEPLAATIAGRRADLAQQAALTQTRTALADQARLSGELRAVFDVSVTTAATLDLDRLLVAAADLTKENFGLYHTHIYLINDARTELVLRAGAGEIGRQMVNEGRRIPVDAASVVARAARDREVVIIQDTREST